MMDTMDDREQPYLFGALSLLDECDETMEGLFARYEGAEDVRAKRKIVEAALHELKIHATIEELLLHPGPEPSERAAERRNIERLIAELEPLSGGESFHDASFAALSQSVRRRGRIPAILALGTLLFAAAGVRGQSNQGGGEQLNPNTSLNSIISGGPTGQATPVNKVLVPVTPASEPAPASNEKDRPPKRPLRVIRPPAKRKLSDRALAKKVRGEIVHDLTLPPGSQSIKVAAAAGKVTLTGTALSADDKYKIAAKAAVLVGEENVVNLIEVRPAVPPQ
jgi:hypothetical protein